MRNVPEYGDLDSLQGTRVPASDTMTDVLIIKERRKRSRNGCANCKRLKIKCDETKPSCEYCTHRRIQCIYVAPASKTKKKTKRSGGARSNTQYTYTNFDAYSSSSSQSPPESLINDTVQNLNSLLLHLDVTNFELQLLRYFVDFSGNFFSFGINPEIFNLWTYEVPKLWGESPLIRSAIYALSSVQLWTYYKLKDIVNIYVDEQQCMVFYEDYNIMKGTPLYERTNYFFQNTLSLLKSDCSDLAKINDPYSCAQIIAANIIMFAFTAVHPVSPVPVIAYSDGSNGFRVDILEICRTFAATVYPRVPSIYNTKYLCMVYPVERFMFPPKSDISLFEFIDHLKYYVNSRFEFNDPKHSKYMECIDQMEAGCYRSVTLGYIMPFFRAIIQIAKDGDFVHLLRTKDYTALKLIFYHSALCSISGLKLFSENSIWDTYVDEFKNLSFSLFNGRFEDWVDQMLYDNVTTFRSGKVRFKAEMFKNIGMMDYNQFASSGMSTNIKGLVAGYPPPAKH